MSELAAASAGAETDSDEPQAGSERDASSDENGDDSDDDSGGSSDSSDEPVGRAAIAAAAARRQAEASRATRRSLAALALEAEKFQNFESCKLNFGMADNSDALQGAYEDNHAQVPCVSSFHPHARLVSSRLIDT